MPNRRSRRGSMLIEVLVGLVLLASAGIGLISLLGQTAHSIRTTAEAERATRRASSELDRFVVVDRAGLLARAGRTHVRGWTVDVDQIQPDLFDVRIAESDTAGVTLHTLVYRPPADSSSVTP